MNKNENKELSLRAEGVAISCDKALSLRGGRMSDEAIFQAETNSVQRLLSRRCKNVEDWLCRCVASSLCHVGVSRLLAMTIPTLALAAVLAMGIMSESWAVDCPTGKKVCKTGCIDESLTCGYCGSTCGYTLVDGAVTFYGTGEAVSGYKWNNSPFYNNQSITSVKADPSSRFTSIGNYAFYKSSLQSIDMPDVTYIGYAAFSESSLKSIDLSKVTGMEQEAFYNTKSLTDIIMSDTTLMSPYASFSFSSKTKITCWGDESICYIKLARWFSSDNCPENIETSLCTCSNSKCITLSQVKFPTAEQCNASGNYYYNTSANDGNGGCRKLPTTRADCSSSGNIWNSTSNKCEILICPTNCVSCNSTTECTACKADYLTNPDGGCTAPADCKDGLHVDGNACVANTDANCNTEVDGQCTECKADYLTNSDGGCTATADCKDGWHIDGDTCAANSDANCNTEVDGQCTECKADYLTNSDGGCTAPADCTGEYIIDSTNNSCKKIPGCMDFADGACGGCETGYYKKDGGCVAATDGCGEGYLKKGTSCISATQGCGSSFRLNDGECDRIRYTPAEAAQYLKDTDNEIIMTFKVNR